MGPKDLAQVLSGLPSSTDPNVLVGTSTGDDAAVYRVSDELALIQTIDFFPPIVDDPYQFGAIAAANSLSDVYAMGGTPTLALNVVGFPRNHEDAPLSVLGEILRGGADKAREAGIEIPGGHTVDDNEPKYGLSVTGYVHPNRIWRNVGAHAGDALVLTKAIGTGIIATAMRKQKCPEESSKAALTSMAMLNKTAAELGRELEVHACTDVTGFGLLGHLREMLGNGDVGVSLSVSRVPIMPGTRELADAGFMPGGSRRNLEAVADVMRWDDSLSEISKLILCDAQTSGGLLMALPPEHAATLAEKLVAQGIPAAVIGSFTGEHPGEMAVGS